MVVQPIDALLRLRHTKGVTELQSFLVYEMSSSACAKLCSHGRLIEQHDLQRSSVTLWRNIRQQTTCGGLAKSKVNRTNRTGSLTFARSLLHVERILHVSFCRINSIVSTDQLYIGPVRLKTPIGRTIPPIKIVSMFFGVYYTCGRT